jgi:hypothetical protein
MKIKVFVPFFNEHMLARINILSSLNWVDEFHLTEANFTFQGKKKEFVFDQSSLSEASSILNYHPINFENDFLISRKYFPHLFGKFRPSWHPKIFFNTSWYNEAVQRNRSCDQIFIDDDDIIILSDIDEIIDPRKIDIIIDAVNKYKIITIKMYFSLLYFNLFSTSWSGPEDYSYRMFIMKGSEFRKRNFDYDTLRKLGERSQLINEIYCIPEICGFHHSWIGNLEAIKSKLVSYAHVEHLNLNDDAYIQNCLKEGRSLFRNHELIVNDSIPLLDEIEQNRNQYKQFFFEK